MKIIQLWRDEIGHQHKTLNIHEKAVSEPKAQKYNSLALSR